MRAKFAARAAAVIALSLAATACSSAPVVAQARHKTPEPPPPALDGFGPGCGYVPPLGLSGLNEMALTPFVTAAYDTPLLTSLAYMIQQAGLTSELNSARALTVFAPENTAFTYIGVANMHALLANRRDLVRVIRNQVVAGRHGPAQLATGRELTTLAGTKIRPRPARRQTYTVNGATIICGGIRTANATVYIVSNVLTPLPLAHEPATVGA